MPSIGRVVELPVRRGADAVTKTVSDVVNDAAGTARRLTEEESWEVDDWGRDPGLVRRIMTLSDIRWDVSLGGDQHLPKRAGALIVVNARRFALTSVFTSFAISRAIDRPVRFVGRGDTSPRDALARRLGGMLDHPDEVYGALRAGELVVLSATASGTPRGVGLVDHTIVGAAVAAKVKVFPGATTSTPFGRLARVEIGPAVRPPRTRRGPLVELELADRLADEIRRILYEMGDISTGTPLDWLPFTGLGGG